MSMTDNQLDEAVENQLKFAQRSLDISEKALLIQEANVQATMALAMAIENLANTQKTQPNNGKGFYGE